MICRENLILALDQAGALLLVQASPKKLDIVDRRTVSEREPTWAHLGIEGEMLLVRSLKDVSVWRWKE